MSSIVLVTGGTGYVGSHCVLESLKAGYKVRTTFRSKDKVATLIKSLDNIARKDDKKFSERVEAFKADLDSDDGWDEAISGCDYVVHVASPLSDAIDKPKDEVVQSAILGTRRVLELAKRHGVKRVVLTSSDATITFGHEAKLLNEEFWSVSENIDSGYISSKIESEKAAWKFISSEVNTQTPNPLEITVLNPSFIWGPCIPGYHVEAGSIALVKALIDGTIRQGAPKMYFSTVDVRDVAKIHIQAMVEPQAKNRRFILCSYSNSVSLMNLADNLRFRVPAKYNKNIPTSEMPNWILRILAFFSPKMRFLLDTIHKRYMTSQRARSVFHWEPISTEKSTYDTYKYFVEQLD